MSKVTNLGETCPNCGAEGRYNGEHETAVRNYQIYPAGRDFKPRTIVDVGWRCWNCGGEWGFEVPKEVAQENQDQKPVFVTEDKAMHQGGILSGTDKEILESVKTGEGMITIESAEQLRDMAKQAAERFEEFKELCSPMELWQARIVRVLRVEEKCSWRAVAEVCYKLGWGKWSPPSNQIMGMALCERAAELFGENYREAPWN